MNYVLIALGSALGGMARYWCATAVAARIESALPWGTILVNVLGSFVIGAIAGVIDPSSRFTLSLAARENINLFFMIGVLGGYTTFSSFSLQTLALLRDQHWMLAATNVLISVAACLIAVAIGYGVAVAIAR